MKRWLVAALCAAMNSPVVVAEEKPISDLFTTAEIWEVLNENCGKYKTAEIRAECFNMIRDLKAVVKKRTKREIVNGTVHIFHRYECTKEGLLTYGISRAACVKGATEKAPYCENLVLKKTNPEIGNIMDFVECLLPNRACDEANTIADPSWRGHCAKQARHGQG